jgi:F-type H+-transporting ATPase subunit epsilon
MNTFSFQSLGITGELFAADDVEKVTARTKSGQITILANHTSMVSVLDIGQLIVHTADTQKRFVISGGVIEVRDNGGVIALVDEPKRATDIDIAAAREAKQEARSLMKGIDSKSNEKFVEAETKLRRNMAKLKAAQWRQSHFTS